MNGLIALAAAGLGLFLGLGGGDKELDQDRVALFRGPAVEKFSANSCDAKPLKRHPEYVILCDVAWHPMEIPKTTETPEVVYRLFLAKPNSQPTILRISAYKDGSGSLWVTTFVKDELTMKPVAKAKVADLTPADLSSLLARFDQSDFWKLTESVPGVKIDPKVQDRPDCSGSTTYIVEGQRGSDYRALAARSCTKAKWLLNLGGDIVVIAKAKIPDLN